MRNNNDATCVVLPAPAEAYVKPPGFFFTSAMNSGIELAGKSLPTVTTKGLEATIEIGMKSVVWKLTFVVSGDSVSRAIGAKNSV